MMRKPVLTIFYQFNPWNSTIGGIQTLIKSFVKYSPQEFELRLVGTGNSADKGTGKWQEAELAGRSIHFLPLFKLENDNVRHLIPTTLKYTTAMMGRELSSDFMHFHRIEPSIVTFPWQGEKTLFIHNDIQSQMQAQGSKKAILWRHLPQAYFALEKLLVGQFSQILSCNSDSTQLYKQRYPDIAQRISYIKNSFDNEIFYPLTKEEKETQRSLLASRLGLSPETRFVLFAGRLHPQKDPLLLVRAFAALKEENIHLLIAGDGELAQEIRKEIEMLGLSNRITMLGAVVQEELAKLHRVSHCFVLSSAYEGLPLVVLEALASGTPVVTTECGETPKLLSAENGVVCQQRTPECIAENLHKVVMNPESYPMEACVQTAQPYTATAIVNQVYEQMWQSWEQSHS